MTWTLYCWTHFKPFVWLLHTWSSLSAQTGHFPKALPSYALSRNYTYINSPFIIITGWRSIIYFISSTPIQRSHKKCTNIGIKYHSSTSNFKLCAINVPSKSTFLEHSLKSKQFLKIVFKVRCACSAFAHYSCLLIAQIISSEQKNLWRIMTAFWERLLPQKLQNQYFWRNPWLPPFPCFRSFCCLRNFSDKIAFGKCWKVWWCHVCLIMLAFITWASSPTDHHTKHLDLCQFMGASSNASALSDPTSLIPWRK